MISSSVGPKPPVIITVSFSKNALSKVFNSLSRLSPTVVCLKTPNPSAANSFDKYAVLVFTISPNNNSVPTETNSTLINKPRKIH